MRFPCERSLTDSLTQLTGKILPFLLHTPCMAIKFRSLGGRVRITRCDNCGNFGTATEPPLQATRSRERSCQLLMPRTTKIANFVPQLQSVEFGEHSVSQSIAKRRQAMSTLELC
jgi:hypothetical protein